jgi:hypothetical protein
MTCPQFRRWFDGLDIQHRWTVLEPEPSRAELAAYAAHVIECPACAAYYSVRLRQGERRRPSLADLAYDRGLNMGRSARRDPECVAVINAALCAAAGDAAA